mgnify:FL=1
MNNSQNSAYIEIESLKKWNMQISRINNDALNKLDSYLKTVESLENHMLGNVSTGFINDSSKLVEKAKKYHTQMRSVENFLLEVIETMSNQ